MRTVVPSKNGLTVTHPSRAAEPDKLAELCSAELVELLGKEIHERTVVPPDQRPRLPHHAQGNHWAAATASER